MLGGPAVIAAFFWAGCSVEEEQPSEEAAEEAPVEETTEQAAVEETTEPSPEEIQAEGCPEGQISNEAGTECFPLEEHERQVEEQERAVEERARA
jgi:type IV secretory pathway VirB10-like protein